MARVKNTMELIDKSTGYIDARYDMCVENIQDIWDSSKNAYDLIVNGFRVGYMQGAKAAKSELKRGVQNV